MDVHSAAQQQFTLIMVVASFEWELPGSSVGFCSVCSGELRAAAPGAAAGMGGSAWSSKPPQSAAGPPAHSSCCIMHHLNAIFTVDIFQTTLPAPQEREWGIFGILSALHQASEPLCGCWCAGSRSERVGSGFGLEPFLCFHVSATHKTKSHSRDGTSIKEGTFQFSVIKSWAMQINNGWLEQNLGFAELSCVCPTLPRMGDFSPEPEQLSFRMKKTLNWDLWREN